ncbi:MAG: ethanolamine ammonia lyase small subunit, partial [Clostridia bacterium]|nr:ethanolamine ammonia lyase small subunit [Clostridia bacterium]
MDPDKIHEKKMENDLAEIEKLRQTTPARIGIGRAGARYKT